MASVTQVLSSSPAVHLLSGTVISSPWKVDVLTCREGPYLALECQYQEWSSDMGWFLPHCCNFDAVVSLLVFLQRCLGLKRGKALDELAD